MPPHTLLAGAAPMRILAVLDHPQTAALTLDTARQLSLRTGIAEIYAMHPKLAVDPDFQSPDEGLPDPAQQTRFAHTVATRAKAIHQIFADWAATLPTTDQPRLHWLEPAGDIRTLVANAAAKVDLVILPRPGTTPPHSTEQAFTGALYDAQATVLLPPLHPQATLGQHPVVAWQDNPSLTRALQSALPLLRTARQVTVLIGQSQSTVMPEPAWVADLRASGVAVNVDRFTLADQNVGEQISAHAQRAGADLLIMGAYGRPQFIEWLLDGPTHHMLHHGIWPILTHHEHSPLTGEHD
ncbi:MAG: universal stress protein [Acetobacter syzygii]|uniref:universal stress protein n=1 Tax=Acetobacter syzygii TaxID=146476 RepID=UPI0039E9C58E